MDKSSDQEACLAPYVAPISTVTNTVSGLQSVIEISGRQTFTHEEASRVLPIVLRITKVYSQKVDALIERLEALAGSNTELASTLEAQADGLIQEWQQKIQKLGALPKGIWIADFDAGDGYFCWKYPERSIEYWHKYNDGFSRRVLVADRSRPTAAPVAPQPKKIFALTPVK